MKKLLSIMLVVLLLAGMAVTGTMAYLTSEDSDVNVMTLGNVKIEQIEQEWNEDNELQPFTQGKPLYPYVGTLGWVDKNAKEYRRFSMNNVVDKYVTVKNTGRSDAYVRTLIALEMGEFAYDEFWDIVGISNNAEDGSEFKFSGAWNWADDFVAEIDGKNYCVMVAVHKNPVKPGETTIPSLLQVYLSKDADNEDVEAIDGNKNGMYDILVLSQAVQTNGFADAEIALNTAFGTASEKAAEWFGGMKAPTAVATADELIAALEAGESVYLTADVDMGGTSLAISAGKEISINLNGYKLTNKVSGGPAIVNNGTLTIEGDGAIANGTNDVAKSHTILNYGTLIINGGKIGTDDTAGAAVINDGDGTAIINGGTFASKQENVKSDGLCAYVFINNGAGTMTINDATFNGQTHGLFGAYNGNLIVNGGSYTMDGNGGLGCYVVYATKSGKVTLNGGIINTNNPRNGNVFFVYDSGNYFNAKAVETGKVVVNGATIYLNGAKQNY